jgi:hypothetical protein
MAKYQLTERAKHDLAELEAEVNNIIAQCTETEGFDLRTTESKRLYSTAVQLMCMFVRDFMHRFERHQRTRALAEWFGKDRTTMLHHFKGGNIRLESEEGFRHMYSMLSSLGIQCTTEGWIRSHELRIRFIDRQISILKDRRKKLEKKREKGCKITLDDLSL